jgi:hypothetical protein
MLNFLNELNLTKSEYSKLKEILFENIEIILFYLAKEDLILLQDLKMYPRFFENYYLSYYINLRQGSVNFDFQNKKLEFRNEDNKQGDKYIEIRIVPTIDVDRFLNNLKCTTDYFDGPYRNVVLIRKEDLDFVFIRFNNSNAIDWEDYYHLINFELFNNYSSVMSETHWRIILKYYQQYLTKEYIIMNFRHIPKVEIAKIISCEHLYWTKSDFEKVTEYLLQVVAYSNNKPINVFYEISGLLNIEWTIDLIKWQQKSWCWRSLTRNEKIFWTEEKIDLFIYHFDFDTASCCRNIDWSIKLIQKYQNRVVFSNKKWNWSYLSANSFLPWNEELIDTFIDLWNFTIPCYPSGIRAYENNGLSILNNKSILWSDDFLSKYKSKIDIWSIARYGNLSRITLSNIKNELEKKYWTHCLYHKYSDSRHSCDVYESGFEVLGKNNHTVISKNDFYYYIDELIDHKIIEKVYSHGQGFTATIVRVKIASYFMNNELPFLDIYELINNYDIIYKFMITKNAIQYSIWMLLLNYFKNENFKRDVFEFFSITSQNKYNDNYFCINY